MKQVHKLFAAKGACISGWDICMCLFCCCSGVSWAFTCNYPPPSNAVDRSFPDVRVDVYTFLPSVWKLFVLSLSMGKSCGKSSWTISGQFYIFGPWIWKRLVDVRSVVFFLLNLRYGFSLAFSCLVGHQRQQSCCDIAACYYGLGMAFLAILAPALPSIFGITALFLRYFWYFSAPHFKQFTVLYISSNSCVIWITQHYLVFTCLGSWFCQKTCMFSLSNCLKLGAWI